MGGTPSRVTYSLWDLVKLASWFNISVDEVHQWYQQFNQIAGKDGKISRCEFDNFYRTLPVAQYQNPAALDDQVIRVFRTFDLDNSFSLSFEEFLNGIIMMNYNIPLNERYDYLIRNNNPYQFQGDGQIRSAYGQQVFQYLDKYHGSSGVSGGQHWNAIDPYGKGAVSQQDMLNYINQQNIYNQQYQYAGV